MFYMLRFCIIFRRFCLTFRGFVNRHISPSTRSFILWSPTPPLKKKREVLYTSTYICLYVTCYISPMIYCLLMALAARMFSRNGYGPGTNTQGLRNRGSPRPRPSSSFRLQPWSLLPGGRAHIHYG